MRLLALNASLALMELLGVEVSDFLVDLSERFPADDYNSESNNVWS